MEKIVVNVSWCDKNFGASLSENVPGAVVVTAKTYDELIDEIRETLNFHVEGMIADGDDVPQWLRDGDYEFEYHLDTAALLQMCSPYASIAAISRVSGINQHQLSQLLEQITVTQQSAAPTGKSYEGLTFVITGDLHHYQNRNELNAYIESQGGHVAGSVSGSTSFLINNDVTSTSGKNKKAQQLGIPIISEDDFINRFTE